MGILFRMRTLLTVLSLAAFAFASPLERADITCPLFYSPWAIDANQTQFTCLRIVTSDETWNTHRVECAAEGTGYRLAILNTVTQVELANYLPTIEDYSYERFFVGKFATSDSHSFIFMRCR